ncbi:hypothetical protein AB6D15_23230 [Vibrio splendidus]
MTDDSFLFAIWAMKTKDHDTFLLAIGYWLLAIGYWLLAVMYFNVC